MRYNNLPVIILALVLLSTGLTLLVCGLDKARKASVMESERQVIERIQCARDAKASGKDWLIECYQKEPKR